MPGYGRFASNPDIIAGKLPQTRLRQRLDETIRDDGRSL